MPDSEPTDSLFIAMLCSRKTLFILALLALTLVSEKATGDQSYEPTPGYNAGTPRERKENFNPNATPGDRLAKSEYMSPDEFEVLTEINRMRRNPAEYARLRLEPLRSGYHGKLFFSPGGDSFRIRTKEGVEALDECIRVLQNTAPMPPFLPSEALTLAARELAQEQGATTLTGHIGTSGATMPERVQRHGNWRRTIAENISYGIGVPRYIVAFLLIDDGVSDRGHRVNLLNARLDRIGISIGPHRRYNSMCVMDFAAGYTTKKQ